MIKPVIEVQHISKEFVLSHQVSERYLTLREVLSRKVSRMLTNRKSVESKLSKESFLALNEVSFSIQPGQRVGIIGRNGAGKSTLLKILSRISEPTKGSIRIRGRIASLLEVGTGFHPELTGRENVYLNGAIFGMSRADVKRQFDEIVAFAEVEKFLDTPVKRYSSGMYVRLAFAVAAHLDPEILIVDEVLAVGDAQFQKKCVGKMEDVSKGEGRTLLFVSHNMATIQKLCNESILMHQGRLIFQGNTDEAVQLYLASGRKSDADWSRRQGSGKAQLTSFQLEDAAGDSRTEFIMGDDLYVNIKIAFKADLQHIDIGMNIKNMMDETITHLTNLDSGFDISGTAGEQRSFRIKVASCWFSPGQYSIDIALVCQDAHYDVIDSVSSFHMLQHKSILRPGTFPSHVKVYTRSIWQPA